MKKIYDNQTGAKEEWAKMKGQPLKKKLSYLWEYYGLTALAVLAAIIFLVSFVPSCIENRKPNVISGEFIFGELSDDGIEDLRLLLCEKMEKNPKRTNINVFSRMVDSEDVQQLSALREIIMAKIMAKEVDFFFANEDTLEAYMDPTDYEGCSFADLHAFLSDDLIAELESQGRVLYYTLDDGTSFPYLIDPSNSRLTEILELKGTGYIGLVVNSKNPEGIVEFCKLIAEAPAGAEK